MQQTFDIVPSDILQISAKTGQGVSELLRAIVDRVPPPAFEHNVNAVSCIGASTLLGLNEAKDKMRALLFDSQYDKYRGVVSLVSLQSGQIRKGKFSISRCHADFLILGYRGQDRVVSYPQKVRGCGNWYHASRRGAYWGLTSGYDYAI